MLKFREFVDTQCVLCCVLQLLAVLNVECQCLFTADATVDCTYADICVWH